MTVGLQLIVSTALVAAAPSCAWSHPGANPYRGDPANALAEFDLPEATRQRLRALLHAHQPTDDVTITRDAIAGAHAYTDLRDMHSGRGRICHGRVDRSAWSARHRERARVYCADDACVIVPAVCNNVALVTRRPDRVAALDDSPIDIEPAAGPPPAGRPAETPADAPPPLDFMSPPDIASALPGAPDAPAGIGSDEAGAGLAPAPGPISGGPVVGLSPPCCDLLLSGPGAPGSPPVVPPLAVPETPAWTLLLAGAALVWAQARSRSGWASAGHGDAK